LTLRPAGVMRPPNPSYRGEKPRAKHRHAMHMGTANAGALLFKDAVLGSSLLKLALDGLEREFKLFNWLEGRMCTTRAPGDQEKSIEGQCGRGGLAVAQECSDGHYCQPSPQSEITGK
jgi:hypothetical protein